MSQTIKAKFAHILKSKPVNHTQIKIKILNLLQIICGIPKKTTQIKANQKFSLLELNPHQIHQQIGSFKKNQPMLYQTNPNQWVQQNYIKNHRNVSLAITQDHFLNQQPIQLPIGQPNK